MLLFLPFIKWGGKRQIVTHDIPIIFSSGQFQKDRIPSLKLIAKNFRDLTGLNYKFSACNTFEPMGVDSQIYHMESLGDDEFIENSNTSKGRVWAYMRGLYTEADTRDLFGPVDLTTTIYNLGNAAQENERIKKIGHSENLILFYINQNEADLVSTLDGIRPVGGVLESYILNIHTLRDACEDCKKYQYIQARRYYNGRPLFVLVSSLRQHRGSRDNINLNDTTINTRYKRILLQIMEKSDE